MNRRYSFSIAVGLAAVALGGCPTSPAYIECKDDTSCGLAVGGHCLPNPATGHKFCQYPDGTCPGGFRWSDYDVEESISGTCVAQGTDAGVDAPPPDAPPDGPPDAPGVSQWAHAFGGPGVDVLADLAVAADESAVIVGTFEQSVSFGGGSLTSAGGRDAFVAKLSPSGDHLWSKRFGGTSSDLATAVALDAAGNVYVIGQFIGSVDFDGQALASGAAPGEFVLKLDGATGARIWAVHLGTALAADRQDVAVTAAGDAIAIGGAFYGTILVGASSLVSAGGADAVVAKLDGSGQPAWSRRIGGTGTDEGRGVAFVGAGDVAVVGSYQGAVAFGGPQSLAAVGGGTAPDGFAARYASTNGAHVWSFGVGGASTTEALTVATDASAIYVGSYVTGSATFGGGTLTANGSDDGVIAKFDAATGSHIWSRQFGGAGQERTQRLIVDGAEVWFGGYFGGTTMVGTSALTSAGVSDIAYGHATSATGDFVSGGSAGGIASDDCRGFGLSASHVWIASTFTVGFPVFGASLSSAGMSDVFIGRTER